MSPRPLLKTVSRLVLGLCLGAGVFVARADEPAATQSAPAQSPAAEQASALTPQVLYQFLLAEIAGARGNLELASQGYLDLARKTQDARIAHRAAEIALYARRVPDALEAARLWNKLEPDNLQAVQMLAGLLAGGMGQLDELEPQLARILAKSPEGPAGLLMALNGTLQRYPDKAEVRRSVDRLTEPYLKLPEANFARAHAAFNAGDADAALASLDAALVRKSDWEPAALLKAQLQQQQGRTKDAIAFLAAFRSKQPQSVDIQHAYARLLAADRQYDAARVEFDKLVTLAPDNGEIGYTRALLLLQAGDANAAEAEFKRLLVLGKPDPDTVRMQIAQIQEEQKRIPEAILSYRAITGGAQRNSAWIRAALLQARGGDLAGARSELARLRAAEPKEANTFLLAEAQILRELDRAAEAYALLDAAIRKQPDQTELIYDRALLAERLGKYDEMERDLRRLIKLKPDEAQSYNALGYSFADRNIRLAEANTLIRKALELAPDDAFILDSMGWVLYRSGNLESAYEHLKRAFEVRPDPEIAAHIGEVLWMMGRQDDARKTWQDALAAHPQNEELAKVIKRFTP
ncbi:tetratricopeptide repeat protein [Niveibacterium microcysteis]|uniref:Tetratricopeptide repeat protein n=1 Tax=Niveibacterium microcysteis TaxID=2811415 RepID=A0ABX7M906_9RHOO|nr:tetratricopeptide repeat protein [Niveibacterium microcysteis]QSI77643.1 tetratricopeptide repeat protein [Niveibacterium microcysteis]